MAISLSAPTMNNGRLDTPTAISVNALVFSGGEVWDEGEDEPDAQANAVLQTLAQSLAGPSGTASDEASRSEQEKNVSTYVRVFEDMVSTVLRQETELFDHEEFALLTLFAHLSYEARFLMVKLLLRKQETWHRLDTLNYQDELGSISTIVKAIDELCPLNPDPLNIVKKEEPEGQGTDPFSDEGIANNPASMDTGVLELSMKDKSLALARNEREIDLKSLLECLRVDELKDIAKQLKLKKKNQKKDDLINDLLGTSCSQTTLTNYARKDGATPSKTHGHRQTKFSFGHLKLQKDRLRDIALSRIVKCVRVDEEFFGVIHRVNLVYFRLTQYTPGILVAALLTRFGKRAYPGYEYERTKNIWSSRQALIDFEKMLNLEAQVDALLAGNVPPLGGRAGSRTPVSRFLPTPVTPGNANGIIQEEDAGDEDVISDVKPDSVRVRGARMVIKDIFEQVYPIWQDLVETKGEEVGRANGLERFHHGHVLTRIICKGSTALGILKEHGRELEVLEALLAQKRWRRGQRGKWYERRAVILSRHFPKDEKTLERTLDAVIEALKDPDTHIVCRPKLQRRLEDLENKLKIPIQERHTCDGSLADATEVTLEAVRLKHRASSLKLDRTGRCINADTPLQGNRDIKRYYSPVTTSVKSEPTSAAAAPPRRKSPSDIPKGKTLWLGQNDEELSVEALALQRYEEQGFKGVHCETRVISMLFGLLFWDVIFKSIPGAFETPYQTAPLDIAEDSFYHARKDDMEERLAAIEAGKGPDLIRIVDAEHRASGTWCVGVRWDLFSTEDLVDIVTCIGGKALSVICRVLCENYTFGTSGGPDLFLWNAEKGTCKFVEVKGPGDRLQENQRVWIDILVKAPVAVELCHVDESGGESSKKPNTRTPKSTHKKAKKTPRKMKMEKRLVDADDADALPTIVDDTLEQPIPPSTRSSPGADASCIADTSSPLKRKAGPSYALSPIPKRPRSS